MDKYLKQFCDEVTPCISEIRVYKGNKRITIWVSKYNIDNFLTAVNYCLETNCEHCLNMTYFDDNLMVSNLENILNYNFLNGYNQFIQSMSRRKGICFSYENGDLKE